MVAMGARKGKTKGVCPRCGEPGTGEGVVGEERRFFHGPDRSCYLGMLNPKRVKRAEATCPTCGELGRESLSKGYRYFRHKSKSCYVGKASDQSDIQQVEPSEEYVPDSDETTSLYTEPSETKQSSPPVGTSG